MRTIQAVSARDSDARQWLEKLLVAGIFLGLMIIVRSACASEGTEFTAAVAKWQQWVSGNLGKLAALIAIGVGSIVAAVRKDWSWFFGAIVLSMGIGVIIGIVNASFTATI